MDPLHRLFMLLQIVVLWVLGWFWGPIKVDSEDSFYAMLIT
jgi:hypothetical protein